MAKTRLEKIESIQTEIQQLENQRKRLLQAEKEQERKDRTKRLCSNKSGRVIDCFAKRTFVFNVLVLISIARF